MTLTSYRTTIKGLLDDKKEVILPSLDSKSYASESNYDQYAESIKINKIF